MPYQYLPREKFCTMPVEMIAMVAGVAVVRRLYVWLEVKSTPPVTHCWLFGSQSFINPAKIGRRLKCLKIEIAWMRSFESLVFEEWTLELWGRSSAWSLWGCFVAGLRFEDVETRLAWCFCRGCFTATDHEQSLMNEFRISFSSFELFNSARLAAGLVPGW